MILAQWGEWMLEASDDGDAIELMWPAAWDRPSHRDYAYGPVEMGFDLAQIDAMYEAVHEAIKARREGSDTV